MTAEEIEIIVTAKIEEALKEFNKIVPAVKEKMKQVQEAFSQINVKTFQNKMTQATNGAKKKLQDLKNSNDKNKIAIKVTNEDAKKQIDQVKKSLDSLKKQTSLSFDPNDISGMTINGLDRYKYNYQEFEKYARKMEKEAQNLKKIFSNSLSYGKLTGQNVNFKELKSNLTNKSKPKIYDSNVIENEVNSLARIKW